MKSSIPASAETSRRVPATFTIRSELIEEARALGLNASRAAESGLEAEIRSRRQEIWLRENQGAVDAHNKRIAERGLLITPAWVRR